MKQSLRTPISLAVLSIIGLVLLINSTGATTMIKTATDTDIFALPDIAINTTTSSALAFALMVIGAIASFFYARKLNRRTPLWVTLVYGFALIYGVLVWLFAGATMPISALLSGALALTVPLVFGSLAGVLSERVGIVNIAIDSQLLAGAFISAVAATLSHNLYVGLIGAVIGGENDDGVVELAHVFELLEDVADVVVHLLHAGFVDAPVLAAGLAHHGHVLVGQHGGDVHARRVVPDEERLVGLLGVVAVEEVDDLGRNLFIDRLRPLQGQRTLVLAGLIRRRAVGGLAPQHRTRRCQALCCNKPSGSMPQPYGRRSPSWPSVVPTWTPPSAP